MEEGTHSTNGLRRKTRSCINQGFDRLEEIFYSSIDLSLEKILENPDS